MEADTRLTTTGAGNIVFADAINGSFGLVTDAKGYVRFSSEVGTGKPLSYLTVGAVRGINLSGGKITTTGTQTYSNAVTLKADTTLTATDTEKNIVFDDTINGGYSLDINAAGNSVFSGSVGGTTPLDSLTVSSGVSANINTSNITTVGSQIYTGRVSLGKVSTTFNTTNRAIKFTGSISGMNQDVSLSSGTGDVRLDGVSDVNNLHILGSGNKVLSGIISNTASLNIEAGGTTSVNALSITTSGNQTYGNAVALGADTTLTTTGAGNIVFADAINGGFGLVTDAKGYVRFSSEVGTGNALSYLTVGAVRGINLSGSGIKTTGDQQYKNAVTLGANTILTTVGAGNITFGDTLNSDSVNTLRSLELNTKGSIIFGGIVGSGVTPLSSLIIDPSAGITHINGGSISTTGLQNYQAPVILGINTTLAGSVIGFMSTVNSDNVGGNAFSSLTLNATEKIVFNSMVGGNNPLHNLIADGGGVLYFLGKGATTTGFQTYNTAIILKNGSTFLTADDNITFNSSITGRQNLSLNAGSRGNILFNGAVGAYADSIGILSISNADNVTANAGIYTTAFWQNAGSGITLLNNILYVGKGSIAGFVHGDKVALIVTDRLVANIDVGEIYLGVNFARLTGFIAGSSDMKAAKSIKETNPFPPGTHYYNGIDLYGLSPTTIIDNALIQELLASLFGNFNVGFGFEFSDGGNSKFDYLSLLNQQECTVEVE